MQAADSCSLAELFDIPPEIKQCDLVEYLDLHHRFELAKADLEGSLGQLAEMLILGSPVQEGPLRVCLREGRVVVEECADR